MRTKLTEEEKARRARDRMLETTMGMSTRTYIAKHVAPLFQRMIRASDAVFPAGRTRAIVDGEVAWVRREVGQCVCITCGKVLPWSGGKGRFGGMHTGHFLASRCNAILFEEDNVAPQCSRCNCYESGAPQRFRQWMLEVRGGEAVERLERLKHTTRKFTREELVDMKIAYTRRLKAAETILGRAEEQVAEE